jgi:hypothetical protein
MASGPSDGEKQEPVIVVMFGSKAFGSSLACHFQVEI